jgi:hypothetical protein
MPTAKPVRGYIIVLKIRDNGEVIALSGSRWNKKGELRRPRWIDRPELAACYVHSSKSIARAILRKRAWVEEVAFIIPATFDPGDGSGNDKAVPEEPVQRLQLSSVFIWYKAA